MAGLDPRRVRDAVLDAVAVLAPTTCSGCGANDRAVCGPCAAALRACVVEVKIGAADPLSVYCGLRYRGVARSVLLALKESGRTDATGALAAAARAAILEALRCRLSGGPGDDGAVAAETVGRIEVATIPSTRAAFRARGYHPTELILARAGLRASHPLRAARQTSDQAALGVAARAVNREGSLRARRAAAGRSFILVDDILTTGATLLEARRAIRAAGGTVVAAATVANTTRWDRPH